MAKLKTIYDLEKINYNLKLINTTNYLKSNNDFQLPIINEEVFKYLFIKYNLYFKTIISKIFNIKSDNIINSYVITDNNFNYMRYELNKPVIDIFINLSNINNKYNSKLLTSSNSYIFRFELNEYLTLNNVKIGYTSIVLQTYEENNNYLIEKCVYSDYQTGKIIKNTPLTTYVSLNKLNNDNNWLSKALKLLTSISISYSYELAGNDKTLLSVAKIMEIYSNKSMNLLMLDDNVTCINY